MPADHPTSVRLSDEQIRKLDLLGELLTLTSHGIAISRSKVLGLAIDRGLEALVREVDNREPLNPRMRALLTELRDETKTKRAKK